MTLPPAQLLITNSTETLTCANNSLGRIPNGAIAISGEHILAIGPTPEVLAQVDSSSAQILDASGKILAPGFVDSHTHLVFGGSRAQEYAAKMTHTPAEIKALGIPVGILATVGMTRATNLQSLISNSLSRLQQMLAHGTTTLESKSGYGLTVADELKLLEVNQVLQAEGRKSILSGAANAAQSKDAADYFPPVDILSTFLGAHDFPQEISREKYIDLVIHEMLPQVVDRQLAEFCDVFCDDGYYSVADSRKILEAGMKAGLKPKIHTDQYSQIGGSVMCADLGVISADHLNYTEREHARRLAQAGVVGVVTPVLDFAVKHPRPFDARMMLEEGLTLALATDLCPACWVESMFLVMQFACRQYRLSPAEALLAATVGGAKALGLSDRGSLVPGQLADIQIWDVPTFEDVIYRLGSNPVVGIIKRGKVIHHLP